MLSRRRFTQGALFGASGLAAMAAQPVTPRPIWAESSGGLPPLVPEAFAGWAGSQGEADIVLPSGYDAVTSQTYDAQLARVYRRADGSEILLVAACAAGDGAGLLVHRPESCYPAAGYRILANAVVDVPPLAVGASGQVGRLRAMPRGRFLTAQCGGRVEQILYWIRIGDEFPTDAWGQQWASASAAWHGRRADGMLLRLSLVSGDRAGALAPLLDFAGALLAAAGPRGQRLLAGERNG